MQRRDPIAMENTVQVQVVEGYLFLTICSELLANPLLCVTVFTLPVLMYARPLPITRHSAVVHHIIIEHSNGNNGT